MICASEQSVIVPNSIYASVKKEFAARGCYFLKPDEIEKVRKTIIINGALNAKIVGQPAYKIAEMAGVKVDEKPKYSSAKLKALTSAKNLHMRNFLLFWLCIMPKVLKTPSTKQSIL